MSVPAMIKRYTPDQAAAEAQRHPKTVLKALAAGELHGTQRVPGGRWSIRMDCLDAWLDGVPCPHKSNVTRLGRTG